MTTYRSESISTPTRNRRIARTATKAMGAVLGVALIPAAIWGVSKASEVEAAGTHFTSTAAALDTLRADAAAQGQDDDEYGSAQGRMEKDIRGANPLIMRALGQKVVDAAAQPQFVTLKDGSKLSVTVSQLDNGQRAEDVSITQNDPQQTESTVSLVVNKDGSFDKLTYDNGGTNMSSPNNIIGGQHFEYGFGGNDYEDSNTAQYADGRDLTNTPGSAIIVNNTYFSTYTPAGPAIETAITDYDAAMQTVNTALTL